MSRIRSISLSERMAELPDIADLNACTELASTSEDLFICALGFEDRCVAIPERLAKIGYRASGAIVLRYSTNVEANEQNAVQLSGPLQQISENVTPLEVDDPDFTSRLREILVPALAHGGDRVPTISFDISVAANRVILPVMKVLLEQNVDLRLLYAEARQYHPTKREFEEERDLLTSQGRDWFGLETGVSSIAISPEYIGQHLDPLPDCVILFPSFKAERSRVVINFVDPSLSLQRSSHACVHWIVGRPPLAENRWRIAAMREINGLVKTDRQREVSTFDYKDAIRVLENIYDENGSDHNITVSPLGSKMQAVGASLFCYMHPDIRVVFAVPSLYYSAHYSTGCRAMWSLHLGNLGGVRERLNAVGRLIIEE